MRNPSSLPPPKKKTQLIFIPYIFLALTIVFFSASGVLHIVSTPRTTAGLIIKVILGSLIVGSVLFGIDPFLARGVYTAAIEEAKTPSKSLPAAELAEAAAAFFAKADSGGGGLIDFLDELRGEPNEVGYRPPLACNTRPLAVKAYYVAQVILSIASYPYSIRVVESESESAQTYLWSPCMAAGRQGLRRRAGDSPRPPASRMLT